MRRFFTTAVLCFVVASLYPLYAQETPFHVSIAEQQEVVAFPTPRDMAFGTWQVGEIEFTIEDHSKYVKLQARHGEIERTHWVPKQRPLGRVAFDIERMRFFPIESSLRVQLNDANAAERLKSDPKVAEVHIYPTLSYDIIDLKRDVDPAEFAEELRNRAGVLSVDLILRDRLDVPM